MASAEEDSIPLFQQLNGCSPLHGDAVGLSAAGLPIGAQIAGRRFEDQAVLEIGRRLEAVLTRGAGHRLPDAAQAAVSPGAAGSDRRWVLPMIRPPASLTLS